MQDYKSLCAVVTICATLINIQTDKQHLTSLYDKFGQPSRKRSVPCITICCCCSCWSADDVTRRRGIDGDATLSQRTQSYRINAWLSEPSAEPDYPAGPPASSPPASQAAKKLLWDFRLRMRRAATRRTQLETVDSD